MQIDFVDEVHARLTPVLPGTPILRPVEVTVPHQFTAQVDAQGRPKAKGPRGILEYLKAHPGGYVQLSNAAAALAIGFQNSWLVQVDVIAPTEGAAHALAEAVQTTLVPPKNEGGPWSNFAPPRADTSVRGLVRLSLQFQVTGIQP